MHLKCDVLLLTDVFGKCINIRLKIKNYGFCPSNYLSASALNWDVILYLTKVELELISDLTCIYSLRKIWEVEFLIFSIDTGNPTIII